jgi:hypothetical protein
VIDINGHINHPTGNSQINHVFFQGFPLSFQARSPITQEILATNLHVPYSSMWAPSTQKFRDVMSFIPEPGQTARDRFGGVILHRIQPIFFKTRSYI